MLDAIDLSLKLSAETYAEELPRQQSYLHQLAIQAAEDMRPVVIVVEGWAGAGKGEVIRCITEKLDPRGYSAHARPSLVDEKTNRHYLYPYWLRLPARGHMALFDGSWYHRVLADRVENLCGESIWQRAYREINAFERHLADCGTILVKLWLHTSLKVQTDRPAAQDSNASWPETGIVPADGHMYEAYLAAVNDMLLKTSTLAAPWAIIEGDDRRWAQVKTLQMLAATLARELSYQPPGGSGYILLAHSEQEASMAKSEKKAKKEKKEGQVKVKAEGEEIAKAAAEILDEKEAAKAKAKQDKKAKAAGKTKKKEKAKAKASNGVKTKSKEAKTDKKSKKKK
jgi:polyphosphate kinase 2 (PPK2 family)